MKLHGGHAELKQEQIVSEGISCRLCTVPFKNRNHREAALFSVDVRTACNLVSQDGSISRLIVTSMGYILELDDVLSNVCLYDFFFSFFLIVSTWLQIKRTEFLLLEP